jgi:hypothetical protein
VASTPKLKNSQSSSRNIFNDIQKMLATHKVQQISFRYEENGSGRIIGIDFSLLINDIVYPFRLPARIRNVELVMYGKRVLTQTQKEQAYRTAWANLRDWISAQLAMIDTGMVQAEEVFLPYLLSHGGQTLFESMRDHQFLLPSGEHS